LCADGLQVVAARRQGRCQSPRQSGSCQIGPHKVWKRRLQDRTWQIAARLEAGAASSVSLAAAGLVFRNILHERHHRQLAVSRTRRHRRLLARNLSTNLPCRRRPASPEPIAKTCDAELPAGVLRGHAGDHGGRSRLSLNCRARRDIAGGQKPRAQSRDKRGLVPPGLQAPSRLDAANQQASATWPSDAWDPQGSFVGRQVIGQAPGALVEGDRRATENAPCPLWAVSW